MMTWQFVAELFSTMFHRLRTDGLPGIHDPVSLRVPKGLGFDLLGGGRLAPTPEKGAASRREGKENAMLTVRVE